MESYSQVIQLITKFTVTSLQMWQFAPNSIHYLLSLWQRLVASVPYVKASEPHMLDTYTPEVTRAYVTSRLEAVNVIVKENLEDPLDDLGQVQQQLDQMSTITRCEYEKTCTLLANLFDQTAQAYQDRLQSMNGGMGQVANGLGMEIAIQEGQLTWLVYLIGAAIGGRVFLNSQDDHDAMDGELACRVLQLMQLTDSRLANGGHCEKLELALLSFFEQFRKIYIGDQVQRSSKVFRRLSEVLGVCNECTLLAVFVRKIITNLKYWSACELIITKTLQILNDLSLGYSSVRKLVKLEEVQFILANHTAEHFPFLGNQSPLQDMRCRSTFYTSLGRLLMIDLGEDEEKFEQFMRPICAQFDTLSKLLLNDDLNNYPAATREEAKKALIGITRDLRGIAFAFNTKGSFMMLFECLYPLYTPVLHRAIDFWYHDPAVTTPVLKLMAELVQNRSQRLQFDVSSPNGNLLFRETSKMIVNYGSRLLSMGEVPKEQLYALKYKGVSICFAMLKSALCGGYVNFGVFRLYGDRALDDALEIFIKVLLSIPQADLLSFPKLSQTYYVLLESLAQDHMSFLAGLESHVFMFILSSISEGLSALDSMVCTGCCSTLDHIVSYLYKWLTKAYKKVAAVSGQSLETHLMGPVGSGNVSSLMFSVGQLSGLSVDAENCIKILKMHPEILQQMLSTILNIMMFEECKNQWSMSRPLLGLILLNEEYFTRLRQNIIQSQTPEKQGSMAQWFDTLMEGIERNLLTKNRDRFTQNLSVFRRDINDSLKMPMINSNNTCVSLGGDMMS